MRFVVTWVSLLGFILVCGAAMYGLNRLSTQFHPYGNWAIVGVIVLVVSGVVAALIAQDFDG